MGKVKKECTVEAMKAAIETRFARYKWDRVRCPSLKAMAAFIEKHLGYGTLITEGECDTSRTCHGGRIRISDSMRYGNELFVFAPGVLPNQFSPYLFRHNSAETYRHNTEVAEWILKQLEARSRQ